MSQTSVPLRSLPKPSAEPAARANIWPILRDEPAGDEPVTVAVDECDLSKTALLRERDGVCCKTLKTETENTLISKDFAFDVIIGAADGLCVPFALTAGLSSLGNSRLVVTAGLAELIAGAISMGIGGFLATQSDQQHFLYVARQTQERVKRSCSSQLEREVAEILAPIGLDERTCRTITNQLHALESRQSLEATEPLSSPNGRSVWHRLARQPLLTSRPAVPESGLTPFLLKHGEGIENTTTRRLITSAVTIGLSYFIAGLIPLIPYFAIPEAIHALYWSILISGIVLLLFGAVKTRFTTGKTGFLPMLYGSVTMLAIGAAAAASAFGLVRALEHGNSATIS